MEDGLWLHDTRPASQQLQEAEQALAEAEAAHRRAQTRYMVAMERDNQAKAQELNVLRQQAASELQSALTRVAVCRKLLLGEDSPSRPLRPAPSSRPITSPETTNPNFPRIRRR